MNANDKNVTIFKQKYFKYYSPLAHIQSAAHPKHYRPILSAWLHTANNAHLALLAHAVSHNMRTVFDTFKRRTISPPPKRHARLAWTKTKPQHVRSTPLAAFGCKIKPIELSSPGYLYSYRYGNLPHAFFTLFYITCINVVCELLRCRS